MKDVDTSERLLSNADRCLATWPAEALDTDRLAEQLTGHRIDGSPALWDVFPPQVPSEALCENIAGRGATRQILAQYEAFLTMPHPLSANPEQVDEKTIASQRSVFPHLHLASCRLHSGTSVPGGPSREFLRVSAPLVLEWVRFFRLPTPFVATTLRPQV